MSKRTSDQFQEDDSDLDNQLENVPMTESCDVIRRKIRTLIDNNEMLVGEFQKQIDVTSNSYSRFMSQNGPDKGAVSNVYYAAWAFFKKREMRGITTKANKKTKTQAAGSEGPKLPDIHDVVLEGEMDDSVEIYDTCDEIRRKINAHLKKPGVTQADFLRCVAAQYHTQPKKPQSSQLAAFRSKKGPYAGNQSAIYYGAYVYFEKLRIKEGKPKSKKRLEMEEVHAHGMETERSMDRFLCIGNERPAIDKLGRVHFYQKS